MSDQTAVSTNPGELVEQSLPWIIRNGIGIQIMETLAVGAFLTAYAIKLGASNLLIGLLAALPHLSQLAQIPALYAVDRVSSRRKVYTISGIIARPMFLVIAVTVLIPDPGLALTVVAVSFFFRYVAGASLSCAWNTWMRELVPDDMMGKVFGERQKRMVGIGILVSLLAAGFIDLWSEFVALPETWAFGIVYALAFLGGMYAVVTSRHILEIPHQVPQTHEPLLERLLEPFQQQNFRRLLAFLASWNFAINLAAPFFTVHMLRRMELNLVVVIGLATLSQLAAYLSTSSMVNALAAGTATMFGGLTADLFASRELSLILRWQSESTATEFSAMNFTYWDFFFMFATFIGLYALHRLSLVREDGEVQENVVFDRIKKDAWKSLRNLSSVAGLRSSTDFPLDTLIGEPADNAQDPQKSREPEPG